ncbi:hypothetical protein [Mycolicibacterium smegmatis]|uniref:Uncharacterized protein n=2 Tax=Mycolicibacterium smegmatis TaxID=1772 RepID=A0QW67_MYCS2|nr:hypothetical protein [Mycolicibacterium smegmatis]ABK74085.1 hypothetical protein MSMEG_2831 [Mycolicibacterium smegmatis MC2 155]MBE9621603.1 hypothetical protein [Mycolicibacterium smegmatis]MBE9627998.1 hypothetical protein [Mycolicibacterium smegmatis]MBE9634433.1 hypothetical protein [Mycolicibacterium smegmatis]MBE9646697.1 hypothetical protein [Mycolicibacterium smegmatis]
MSLNLDQVLELARDRVETETRQMVAETSPSDFTVQELIALAAVVRPVYERVMAGLAPPGHVLKLVPPTR